MKINIQKPERHGEVYMLTAVIAGEYIPEAGGRVVEKIPGYPLVVRPCTKTGEEFGIIVREYGCIERDELFWIVTRGRTLARTIAGDDCHG